MSRRYLKIVIMLLAQVTLATSAELATQTINLEDFLAPIFSNEGLVPLLFRIYNLGILAVLVGMGVFIVLYGGAVSASDGTGISRKVNAWMIIRTIAGAALVIPAGPQSYAMIQHIVIKIVVGSLTLAGLVFNNLAPVTLSGIHQQNDLSLTGLPESPTSQHDNNIYPQYKNMLKQAVCAVYQVDDISDIRVDIVRDENGPQSLRYISRSNNNLGCGRVEISISAGKERAAEYFRNAMSSALSRVRGSFSAVSNSYYRQLDAADSVDALRTVANSVSDIPDMTDRFRSGYDQYFRNAYGTIRYEPVSGSSPAGEGITQFADIFVNLNMLMRALQGGSNTGGDDEPTGTLVSNGEISSQWVNQPVAIPRNSQNLENTRNAAIQIVKYAILEEMRNQIDGSTPPESLVSSRTLYAPDETDSGDKAILRGKFERLYSAIEITKHDEPVLAGLDGVVNVVPKGIDRMLEAVLYATVGREGAEYNNPGLLTTENINNPIMYLRTIGIGIMKAARTFYTECLTLGEDNGEGYPSLIQVDDDITKRVYGGTSTAMVGGTTANIILQSQGTNNARVRGFIIASNTIATAASEAILYMAELTQYGLYKFEPLGTALYSLFMIWGAIFGIFLPNVPIMIVVFSLVGWILLIVEAFVAGPLIVAGLTQPNSQQFLGAADQSLMMFLLLYLRPVTMGIAILFACLFSVVAIEYLNMGFIVVINHFIGSDVSASDIAIFFGFMLIYSYVVFITLIQAFSVVGSLPDKIGQWIGQGPMGGTSPLQQTLAVRSQFEGVAQQAAQGVGATTSGTKLSHAAVAVDPNAIIYDEELTKGAAGEVAIRRYLGTGGDAKKMTERELVQPKKGGLLHEEGKAQRIAAIARAFPSHKAAEVRKVLSKGNLSNTQMRKVIRAIRQPNKYLRQSSADKAIGIYNEAQQILSTQGCQDVKLVFGKAIYFDRDGNRMLLTKKGTKGTMKYNLFSSLCPFVVTNDKGNIEPVATALQFASNPVKGVAQFFGAGLAWSVLKAWGGVKEPRSS